MLAHHLRTVGGAASRGRMAIAMYPSFVLDCPDAGALASFYGTCSAGRSSPTTAGRRSAPRTAQLICFQQVSDYRAPEWPGQELPQQVHLDVIVEDLDAGESAVLEMQ